MEEKTLFEATVCFLLKEGKVLLAKKVRKIGAGCWNGYGGGIEAGENPEQAAVRELQEEAGVTALIEDLEKVAVVDFHNTKTDGTAFVCKVHFYLVSKWEGEAQATDEMADPTWFPIANLPVEEMMPADREFVPQILKGKKLVVRSWYAPFQKSMVRQLEIKEVDSF